MMTDTATAQWIEDVMTQHRHLREVVAQLEEFLFSPRPAAGEPGSHSWAATLSQKLLDLHDELFRHFRFEEEPVALGDILERHPEAAGQLEQVLGQHPAMLGRLRRVISDALAYSEGLSPQKPQLRRRITGLLQELREHEEEENHLFQRLEYRDVGAVD